MATKGNFKDLIGMKFGKLTIVSLNREEPKSKLGKSLGYVRYWNCVCECGGTTVIRGSHLTCKSKERAHITRSCGCERGAFQRSDKWREKSIRIGTAFRRCLDQYKANARRRNLSWELTDDQFRHITKLPCYYTGELPCTIKRAKSGEEYVYNGIDRLDNSKGYTVENCVPCCFKVNAMKSDMTLDEFVKVCTKVAEKRYTWVPLV